MRSEEDEAVHGYEGIVEVIYQFSTTNNNTGGGHRRPGALSPSTGIR
jgi:hypothetical protein